MFHAFLAAFDVRRVARLTLWVCCGWDSTKAIICRRAPTSIRPLFWTKVSGWPSNIWSGVFFIDSFSPKTSANYPSITSVLWKFFPRRSWRDFLTKVSCGLYPMIRAGLEPVILFVLFCFCFCFCFCWAGNISYFVDLGMKGLSGFYWLTYSSSIIQPRVDS